MGKIEDEAKNKRSRLNFQRAILSAVEAAGVLTLAAVAPNVTVLLKSFGYDPGRRYKEVIKRSREGLLQKGMLVYKDGHLSLTEKGKLKLIALHVDDEKLKKNKKWDYRWRVLIFDIPEEKKSLRNKIRQTLINIGFFRLQDSVWLYPYECEDLIVLLKADFRIGKDLLYLVVESIENDEQLRRVFSLPTARF